MTPDFSLLVATVDKLAKKMQAQRYIDSIQVQDSLIKVSYNNGFKQGIKLPVLTPSSDHNADYEALECELAAIHKEFNEKIAELAKKKPSKTVGIDYKALIETELEKYVTTLKDTLHKQLSDELTRLVDSIPKPKDGEDGKVLDIQEVNQLLQSLFDDYAKNSQEYIDNYLASIVIPPPEKGEDGKDADEEKILAVLKENIERSLREQVDIWKVTLESSFSELKLKQQTDINVIIQEALRAIPKPENSKDADSEAITASILKSVELFILDNTRTTREELVAFIVSELEERVKSITVIAGKGEPGRDGEDADGEAIKRELLREVQEFIARNAQLTKKEFALFVVQSVKAVQEKFKPKRGVRGLPGKPGEKGDRGNGIIGAEINKQDHLIIKTDDKVIDAGELKIKRFYGGVAPDISYTNTLPTPFKVGNMPKGTQFKNTDLRTLFTRLLYGYEFPVFSEFKVNGLEEDVEVGYKILAGTYPTIFGISNPELLEKDTITIKKDGVLLLERLPNVSPVDVTLLVDESWETQAVISFEIMAYDTTGVSFNKYFSINFKHRIYYGEYHDDITDGVTDPSFNPLNVLRATALISNIYDEYLFPDVPLGAAGYKWFCYPEALGDHHTFFALESDISLIMDDVRKIDITNEYGLTITYNCYRTINEISEQFIMGVK
jgi:hypothetical protein